METQEHPVMVAAALIEAALKDVADVDPVFMPTPDKRAALVALDRVEARLEELRLRVMSTAEDVAAEDGARDIAAWLAHRDHRDRGEARRQLRLARGLGTRWHHAARALREGALNLAQVESIVRALEDLPEGLDPAVMARAEEHLVAEGARFGPRSLRLLGRRVLAVVAPEIEEDHERRLLEREEAAAARRTFLATRRRGDGATDIKLRVSDAVAGRLLTYLQSFTSPRQAQPGLPSADRRPYDERLGHAFGAFLEAVDPARMPLHGGDATTVIVTVDLDDLLTGLGVALVGDEPISAGQARRLACTASILPAVLGGESQILDLGRTRRLFSPAQRKAMAVRDVTCRAEGCDIPAAWCEAHHAGIPWAAGGKTDLADGLLLCSFHHRRAHDHRYRTDRHPGGDLRFHRRT